MSDPAMSEVSKAAWTIVLTVISGTAVYALGNFCVRFFLDPIFDLKKTIGEIGDMLIFYANVYTSPIRSGQEATRTHRECSLAIRQAATKLMGKAYSVTWFCPFTVLGAVPSRKSIQEASKSLIGLSNAVGDQNPRDVAALRREVETALGLLGEK